MNHLTDQEIKEAVLSQAWDSCMNDGGYLYNTLEWAYRDYTPEDFRNEFLEMGLNEKKGVQS